MDIFTFLSLCSLWHTCSLPFLFHCIDNKILNHKILNFWTNNINIFRLISLWLLLCAITYANPLHLHLAVLFCIAKINYLYLKKMKTYLSLSFELSVSSLPNSIKPQNWNSSLMLIEVMWPYLWSLGNPCGFLSSDGPPSITVGLLTSAR